MSPWNPDMTPHFQEPEMQCQCGCGRADMDADFMEALQAIRQALGTLRVSSGFRCPEYNARVSTTGQTGPHTTGRAVDLQVMGGRAYALIAVAQAHGMTGLGISQKGARATRFVHLDNLQASDTGGMRPWLWSY